MAQPTKKTKTVPRARKKPLAIPAAPTPQVTTWQMRLDALANRAHFRRTYVLFALLVLAATTVVWSFLSAKLQNGNADQLVDPYLFQHGVLSGATFPGAHTFLLKWPLFWLVAAIGVTTYNLEIATVLSVLVTVAALAFILWRIERRPLVFGTLCLALASVLLLIPAQPAAGALLPVNMAMLTTRNIEYIVFIVGIMILMRWTRLRSWQFWLGASCIGLVAASDKLFLVISVGGALAALIVYALVSNVRLISLAVRWLVASVAAALVAAVLLILAGHVTHIVGQGSNGPYGLDLHPKAVALGSLYAVLGLFTNFGANPAYNALEVKQIPHDALTSLVSISGVSYLINIILLAAGAWAVWNVCAASLHSPKNPGSELDTTAQSLSAVLVWTTVAALGVFIVTNHYYAVDARYLTISLFAVFVAGATYLRTRTYAVHWLLTVAGVLIVGIVLGLPGVNHTYSASRSALTTDTTRNDIVAQILTSQPVHSLVGDYWRVLPIRLDTKGRQNVVPLSGCTQVAQVQDSTAWQANWQHQSFAYLLSLQGGSTGYPACTLAEVTAAYGHPNASQLIAGTYASPQELLLLYDHGEKFYTPRARTSSIATTVVPITTDQLTNTVCDGPSVMNIVAHEDDDLLFMNPDLLNEIKAGYCVRSVYITAGDAGANKFYWLSREAGSEAAYDEMDGPTKDIWTQRVVQLAPHEYVTIANPHGNSKISLIFMHLPDGNVNGSGFPASGNQSLAKLMSGAISNIRTVDDQSSYTAKDLQNALTSLMQLYQPAEIHTQAPQNESTQYPDHSDHITVGQFVRKAYTQYEQEQYADQVTIPISFYIGYPIHARPVNVSGADLQAKDAAFFAYGKYDSGACTSVASCTHNSVYYAYLDREYQMTPSK